MYHSSREGNDVELGHLIDVMIIDHAHFSMTCTHQQIGTCNTRYIYPSMLAMHAAYKPARRRIIPSSTETAFLSPLPTMLLSKKSETALQ